MGFDLPHLIKHIIKIEPFVCEIIGLPKFAEIGTRVVDNSSAWRMDSTKKLIVSEVNSNEEGFRIFFDGGDLGKRKNVNNLNDFIECQKLFDIEFDKVGGFPNLKEFYWSINYQIPNLEQYEKFLKNKQYENDYPFEKNYHRYTPLNYIYEKKKFNCRAILFFNWCLKFYSIHY